MATRRVASITADVCEFTKRLAIMASETFVICKGRENALAIRRLEHFISRPGNGTTLVMQGPPGCGKSHMLEIAARKLIDCGLSYVRYSANSWSDNIIKALRRGDMAEFHEILGAADFILVDDLENLVGKDRSGEELWKCCDDTVKRCRLIATWGRALPQKATKAAGDLTNTREPDFATRILLHSKIAEIESPGDQLLRQFVTEYAAAQTISLTDFEVGIIVGRANHDFALARGLTRQMTYKRITSRRAST